MIFEPFPKLARLSRDCVVTEKLDGTNAQVYVCDPDQIEGEEYERILQTPPTAVVDDLLVFAGSRTRLITPGKSTDNYGFAQWVWDNAADLVLLGVGRHFGEWWGQGIQRGYGLTEKRFSLFSWRRETELPKCVSVVPTLYTGTFDSFMGHQIDVMDNLKANGSVASPGFMNPEGIVVWHSAARVAFKKTFDDKHKEAACRYSSSAF